MQRWLTIVLAGSSLLLAAPALADQDDLAQLLAKIESLQGQIARLEAGTNDNWLTEQRASEIRALVHDVLADADTRASLLGSAITAGWDNGFKIGSADGNYSLQIAGRLQFRYIYNYQSDPPADGDRHRSGFENRRTRLTFSGHVIDPSWRYQIQGNFGQTGGFTLLDAYIDKRFEDGWTLRFGQFRPKFLLEDSMSSARQLVIERSLVNGRFAQGRTQGLELQVPLGDHVRLSAAYTEGIPMTIGAMGGGNNTPWQNRTTEFAFLGRAEVLVAGNWRQFREFTSWPGEDFGLMIGAAGAWQRDEYGTPQPVTEMFRWTVDATLQFGGANAFVAFIGNHEDTKGGGSVDQYGLVVQGGVFIIPNEWEAYARYEWGTLDGAPGTHDLSVLTVGVNRYFAKHALKWSTDVGYGFNPVRGWASNGAGWRTDAPGAKGQVVVRSQFQLVF